jgi:hypothetical protein
MEFMHINSSGILVIKPKDNEKQIREEIFQKLVQAFSEYLTPKTKKRIRRGLKKTSKILAGMINQVKKKDIKSDRKIIKFN